VRIVRSLLNGNGNRARLNTPRRILWAIVETVALLAIAFLLVELRVSWWWTLLYVVAAIVINTLISEHLAVVDAVRIDHEPSDEIETTSI
jgi:hypothetical protein